MNKYIMKLLGFTLFGMMVLSGCVAISENYQTQTVKVTPPATITPTVALTPTPEATATEVVSDEERTVEIVRNINEYLAGEGKYSLEELKKNSQYFFGETDLINGELPLGMIRPTIGQFILLGGNYDRDTKLMHLYLGTTDKEKNRIVFDYNFQRTFIFGPEEPPVFLSQERTSMYSFIATGRGIELGDIDSLDKWAIFVEENTSKPVSIALYTTLMAEEWGNQDWVKKYDLSEDFRIAMYNELNKFGEAVGYEPSKKEVFESKRYLTCMWRQNDFKGVESLDAACPSDFGTTSVYIRRP